MFIIKKELTSITIESCEQFIGYKCRKTSGKDGQALNPKPFKSTLQENTIKGVIMHPILNIPAFTFEEDESYVDARTIIILDLNISVLEK